MVSEKREGDEAGTGDHGALGRSQLDFFFSDLQSASLSAASLSLPAVHVFSIPADEGINEVCGLTLLCGKNDPMLGCWGLSASFPRLHTDTRSCYASICLSGEQYGLSIIDGRCVRREKKEDVCSRCRVSYLSRWVSVF